MTSSPIQSYLIENLPLAERPWLVASLLQDKVVRQAATDLLTYNFSPSLNFSVEGFEAEDWSPAALALSIIAPSISTLWLRTHPIPDLDEELKRQAASVANNITLPTEDWSLEKAGWIALTIRSDFLARESWEPVLDTWFSDPEAQHGTILACLYGMIPDSPRLFRSLLQRNPSAQNIAIVLHALLTNPLTPEIQFEQINQIIIRDDNKAYLPVCARLVILHILQNQRPQLALRLARHWLDTLDQLPTKIGWINQDPLTWFHDLQAELFQAAARQIVALEPASVTIINEWKKTSLSLSPEQAGLSVLSDLVATARTNQLNDPQQALHYGRKAIQYLTDYLKMIPNPLLADSRLVPLIQELSALFLALGRSFDSESALQLACELQPANPNLLILNARSKQRSKQIDAAIQTLATALILSPTRLDISTQLAETLESAGNHQAALALHQALFDEALASNKPDTTNELYALAKCALQAQQPEKVMQVSDQLLERDPDNGMAYYFRGEAFAQLNKISEALEYLTKATESCLDQPQPWLGLARFHQYSGNQEQAFATLQAAAQTIPDSVDIYLGLGEMYLARHSYTQAQEVLSLASQLAPTHPAVTYQYAIALQQLGHMETAKEVLHTALVANPDDQQLIFAYAQCLIALGENLQALPYLESLIAKEQSNQSDHYIIYAQVLLSIIEESPNPGYQPEQAIQALDKAIRIDPDNYLALALQAEALAAALDYTAALEVYQTVLDTPLINNPAWSNRLAIGMGRTALALGKSDVAIATLQDVIQNDPDTSQPHRLLAEAYLVAHLPENALRAAQSAISLRDDDPLTITWIGTFIGQLLKQNQLELSKTGNSYLLNRVLADSIRVITEIIQANPDQIGSAINLSELQLLAGDQKAARQSLIAIAHSDCALPSDLTKAADHLFALDDTQAGINCLQRAVELETTNNGAPSTSLLVQLAKAYVKAGSFPLAQEAYDQAIQLEPSNTSHYISKSKLLLNSGQPRQALECLQLALQNITSGQSNPDVHFMIANAYLVEGNLPSAMIHAQHALETYAQSRSQPVENTGKEAYSEYSPVTLYTLTAELSRFLLQPESAQQYLSEGKQYLSVDILDQPEYLAYYCLSNELCLEAEGKPAKDLAVPPVTPFNSKNARLLSLNARLAHYDGEFSQAQEYLKTGHDLLEPFRTIEQSVTMDIEGANDPISEYLAFADAAIELRNWASALNCLRKASQLAHTNPLVHLALVRFYTLQAEYYDLCQLCNVVRHSPGPESISESALRGVRNALASMHDAINNRNVQLQQMGLPIDSPYAVHWQARAEMIFEKTNQVVSSIQKFDSFIKDQTEQPFLYNSDDTAAIIAASRRQNGRIDEQINIGTLFQKARKQPPNPALLLQIAVSLTGSHPLEALNASQLSTKYLKHDQSDISALCHFYLANLYLIQGLLPEAQEKLNIALGIWNDEPSWNSMAADIMNQLGDIPGAIDHLEEAVKYDPQNIKHHLALGHAYLSGIASDTNADIAIYQKRAIRNLERATRLAPQNPEPWLALSHAHYQMADFIQADQCVDQILEIDQNNYAALAMKAEIALRSNDPAKARDYAKQAAAQQPDLPAAHLIYAHALESLHRPQDALQALESALPHSGTPLPLRLKRAILLKQLNGVQTAIEDLKSIAHQFPGDPEVFAHLARAYAECDEDESAIQSAQISLISARGILSEHDQAEMHQLLGHLLRKTGQLDQAILHLHNATQIEPDDIEPYLELGIAHKERREYQQALQLFQQASNLADDDPRPFYLAGLALKDGKDYRQSEMMLRKAANLAPQDVNIRRQLAAVVALNLVHNPTTIRVNVE